MPTGAGMQQAQAPPERSTMIKVKTFATPIKIFAAARELSELDAQTAAFLAEEKVTEVYAMSDTTTAGDNGETIGLIRSIVYGVED
jgi:hypothetical protein